MGTAAVKNELRANTDRAVGRGAFGVPTFFVDDELYWGVDRMHTVERQLGREPPSPENDLRHPVDIYFDYSSPFSYVGCTVAERTFGDHATWKPMLLGAVFKQVGTIQSRRNG